ncbi:MAG: hypothetical protein DRN24_04525 [Thermoplasmata archaeon]|nr:MAG: hypothetical protein DRN24_04525 [Thermoplasmata archaeon]
MLHQKKHTMSEEKLVKYTPPAERITPKDDAFHGSPKRISAEWWYFDAVFDNGYSSHLGFKTFSKGKIGLVSPMIELYKDGELVVQKQKKHLFKNFRTSKEYPMAEVSDKPIIMFDKERYKKTGEWVYNFNLEIDECLVDLDFIGLTEGFKIETENESWSVALPKASVKGEIQVNDEKIKVKGIGYHDHNWNYSLLTVMNYGIGWYWGKIRSETFNIVWAKIVKSSNRYELIAVVNIDNNSFYNINPENIVFKVDDFTGRYRRKIPTSISIEINDENIKADVKMKADKIHFGKALVAPYWRYHMKTDGFIYVNGEKENVEGICITEYLKFSF